MSDTGALVQPAYGGLHGTDEEMEISVSSTIRRRF